MNTARPFSQTPCASRSYQLRYAVRAQAVCRMKKVLFEEFSRSAAHSALVRRDANPRRQRSPTPGSTTSDRKQSP
jgi:hypothetical protein